MEGAPGGIAPSIIHTHQSALPLLSTFPLRPLPRDDAWMSDNKPDDEDDDGDGGVSCL